MGIKDPAHIFSVDALHSTIRIRAIDLWILAFVQVPSIRQIFAIQVPSRQTCVRYCGDERRQVRWAHQPRGWPPRIGKRSMTWWADASTRLSLSTGRHCERWPPPVPGLLPVPHECAASTLSAGRRSIAQQPVGYPTSAVVRAVKHSTTNALSSSQTSPS